jgi:hypothetical protein
MRLEREKNFPLVWLTPDRTLKIRFRALPKFSR